MGTEKMKAAAKKMGSALKGRPGILNTLEGEHGEVSSLMNQILSDPDDIESRRETYPTVREKLLVHARCEDLEFYSACREYEETSSLTASATADHEEVERLVSELDAMAIDAPAWIDTFEQLQREVESHVEIEETELFPRCQDVFDSSQLREMDDAYKARKEEVEAEIEPYAPRPTGGQRPPAV